MWRGRAERAEQALERRAGASDGVGDGEVLEQDIHEMLREGGFGGGGEDDCVVIDWTTREVPLPK
jgi:hypothetical protein